MDNGEQAGRAHPEGPAHTDGVDVEAQKGAEDSLQGSERSLKRAEEGVEGVTEGQEGAEGAADEESGVQPRFRYPAVLVLVFVAVVFLIAAPEANWAHAVGFAIEASALILTVATSRARRSVRRHRAIALAVVMVGATILIALGSSPSWMVALAAVLVTGAIPIALGRGMLRLLRRDGVTLNAVAGSLAIYLSTGMVFAWIVGFVEKLGNEPYFAQQSSDTLGDKVYFSFTTLTTTGYGDYTPAHAVGHALAVIEMLTGQIYLVTVIGLLIGNFSSKRRSG